MSESSDLDRDFLEELLEGDVEFAQELFDTYLESAEGAFADAEKRIQGADQDNLFRPFHTLKGASASVGLLGIQDLARTLEVKAKAGDLEFCRSEMTNLREALTRARKTLAEYLESLT